jgi:hypothetical protein
LRRGRVIGALLGCAAACCGAPKPLVRNGGFERPDPARGDRPLGWEQPDGLGVQWADTGDKDRGKAIRMDTRVSEKAMAAQWRSKGITEWNIPKPAGNAIAATYGLSLYSETMPVTSGRAYRVSFDFKGGGGGKVWVRAYGEIRGKKRRRYEALANCSGTGGKWKRFSHVFHPTRVRPRVTEMKVMLYAFWPPGVYWFDNVLIEPVSNTQYEAERRRLYVPAARTEAGPP